MAEDAVDPLTVSPWIEFRSEVIDEREFNLNESNHIEPPFDVRSNINSKICIWSGDWTKLLVDAVVNPTNETLNDKAPFCKKLMEMAGPQLKRDLVLEIKSCRTGEAKVTRGYDLLCKYVIHTVGPKYQQRYISASESALHSSYRSSLQIMKEKGITTLALPTIHSSRRGFPPLEGAHIALRTVRRFLEEFALDPSIVKVIMVLDTVDMQIYSLLMPLYFPRSKNEEERSMRCLPKDLGGKHGEPVIPERKIRIDDRPFFHRDDSGDIGADLDMSVCVGKTAFARMQSDVDNRKQRSPRDTLTSELSRKHRYDRLLRKSREQDLSSVREANIFYRSGSDKWSRPVFVFVGRNYDPEKISFEILCCYLISLMDREVSSDYIIVYLHTQTTSRNYMAFSALRDLYELLDHRYKKNLRGMYIVHPTLWSRLTMWWFTTITTSGLNGKVRLFSGVEYLYNYISPDQLILPQYVQDYDYTINGARYCDFSASSTPISSQ